MTEMSKEERILCAFAHEEPDRVPLYDLISNFGVLKYYAGEDVTLENAEDVVPRAVNNALDMTRGGLPGQVGRRVDERGFVHERVDPFTSWIVDRPFHTEEETVAFIKSQIEWLESYRPDQAAIEVSRQKNLKLKEKFQGTVLSASSAALALQAAYITIKLDMFVYIEAAYPDLIAHWLRVIHSSQMSILEAEGPKCRNISPVAWIFCDMAYKGALMFSPHYLREHEVFKQIHEICDLYHSWGLKVIFHSDGDILEIVPDLITTGVDGMAPIDCPAGMDLIKLKQKFGDQTTFVGGFDVNTLRFANVNIIKEKVLHILKTVAPGGGLILGSSSEELFASLPPENVITMIETTKNYGKYPIEDYSRW